MTDYWRRHFLYLLVTLFMPFCKNKPQWLTLTPSFKYQLHHNVELLSLKERLDCSLDDVDEDWTVTRQWNQIVKWAFVSFLSTLVCTNFPWVTSCPNVVRRRECFLNPLDLSHVSSYWSQLMVPSPSWSYFMDSKSSVTSFSPTSCLFIQEAGYGIHVK